MDLKSQISRLSADLEGTRKNALALEEQNRCRTEQLEARLSDLMVTENELREKVMASEVSYSGRIKMGEQREKELQERIKKLQDEMEMVRIQAETREQELQSKLEVVQSELVVLRSQSMSEEPSILMAPQSASYLHSSPTKSSAENYQVEVESLRSVLDLKNTEISKLRRENQEQQRAVEELRLERIKANSLESKVEDLQFQLNVRNEKEK